MIFKQWFSFVRSGKIKKSPVWVDKYLKEIHNEIRKYIGRDRKWQM